MKQAGVIVCLIVTACVGPLARAQSNDDFIVSREADFDVYYEITPYEIDVLRNVRVIGLTEINGVQFLQVTRSTFSGKEKAGLILFSSVKAVLPFTQLIPERTLIQPAAK